jgi:sodium pump decarboxylase gamma subunit
MFGFGLQVALIGLGIVFIALTFLIGVIKVMAVATGNAEVKKTPDQAAPVKKAPEQQPIAAVKKEDDSDVMAVIAATVAFLTQGRMSIKTITRVPGGYAPSWSLAGRQETMNLRQF